MKKLLGWMLVVGAVAATYYIYTVSKEGQASEDNANVKKKKKAEIEEYE